MTDGESFRRDLAEALVACAARRGLSREHDAADLLRRLAADTSNLDPQVLHLWRFLLSRDEQAPHFLRQRCGHLFAQVGVTVWPGDATDLVRWMLGKLIAERQPSFTIGPGRALPDVEVGPARGGSWSRQAGTLRVAGEFCAGLGLVAPGLAVYQLCVGVGQWREQALAAVHPAAAATVVAVASEADGRTGLPLGTATVRFSPAPGAPPCLAAVTVPAPVAPGATLAVVPRSTACEAPLVAPPGGDPGASFALAAALLAAGVAALHLWDRIWRRSHRASLGRAWSGAVGTLAVRNG